MRTDRILPIVICTALLVERYLMSYAASWILGLVSVCFLVLRHDVKSLLAILGLSVLSLLAPAELREISFRYVIFLALYLFVGNHTALDPRAHLGLQVFFAILSLFSMGVAPERFFFGTSVMLLMLGMMNPQSSGISKNSRAVRVRKYFFLASSLLVAVVGFGSRSALIVWLLSQRKKAIWLLPIAGILGVLIAFSPLISLPFVQKIITSMEELSNPFSENSGAFNLRAYELQLFIGSLKREWVGELLVGSNFPLYLPGEYYSGDPNQKVPFIPHNQIVGIFYQFGLFGILIVIMVLHHSFRVLKKNTLARMIFFALLFPVFLFKHGFIDTDFALIVSSLNWLRRNNR